MFVICRFKTNRMLAVLRKRYLLMS